MTGRDLFTKYKFLISFFVKCFNILPKSIRLFLWDLISSLSSVPFIALRYIILKTMIKNCGINVKIGTNVQIFHWDQISLGNNVSIHSNCYLDGAGSITIGNDVSIAHGSSILSSDHQWNDSSIPIKYNEMLFKKVLIQDDVWVGCGVRILGGVTLYSRSIIAAGAVVNKSNQSNTIYGGIPAKFLKSI